MYEAIHRGDGDVLLLPTDKDISWLELYKLGGIPLTYQHYPLPDYLNAVVKGRAFEFEGWLDDAGNEICTSPCTLTRRANVNYARIRVFLTGDRSYLRKCRLGSFK